MELLNEENCDEVINAVEIETLLETLKETQFVEAAVKTGFHSKKPPGTTS